MKEIRAIIRPQKLPRLREVLRSMPGFPGMTVSKAFGCGSTLRHAPQNIKEELVDFTEKVRVEIIAPDELVDALVDHIVQVATTGQTGDGLVWVTDIQRAVFIRRITPWPIEPPLPIVSSDDTLRHRLWRTGTTPSPSATACG